VTFVHLGLLLLGIVAAVAASDLLGHRGLGRWPVAIGALVLVLAGGYTYSAPVSAFALGTAIGVAVMFGAERVRTFSRTRRRYREATAARREHDARVERAAHGREDR